MKSVQEILEEMPTIPEKCFIAFNKIDKANSESLEKAQQDYPEAVFISATGRQGLETLKFLLLQVFNHTTMPQYQALYQL